MIVLDFSRVSGLARKVAIKNVLEALEKLGFTWGDNKPAVPLEITRLVLNMPSFKQNLLSYDNAPILRTEGVVQVLDYTTDYDAFLTAARRLVEIKLNVQGVEVLVTPYGAAANMQKLLDEIERVSWDRAQTVFADPTKR